MSLFYFLQNFEIATFAVPQPMGDSGNGCGGRASLTRDFLVRDTLVDKTGHLEALAHRIKFGHGAEIAKDALHLVYRTNAHEGFGKVVEATGSEAFVGRRRYFAAGHINMLACYYGRVQVIPAVDVLGDDAVRLERGDYDRVLFRQPLEEYVTRVLAATKPDLLHIVDLQGARDGAFRPEVLTRCQSASGVTPLQVSGGIRTPEQAAALLDAGATRLIVGTAAFATPDAMTQFVEAIGPALVVAIDVKDGFVATKGWLASSGLTPEAAVERCLLAGVLRIHATAVDRDGTMGGPDLDLYRRLCATGIAVVAAGGVRHMDDVKELETLGCEAAVMGTALAQQLGIV